MNQLDFSSLSAEARIQIWRESVAHLRYLNDEVWKRFQFFVWVDFALLFATISALSTRSNKTGALVALVFAVLGILITASAHYILKRNRIYYLQMLLKKTLLEKEAGYYSFKFSGTDTDLALPWRLTPEVAEELKSNPEEWVQKSVEPPGTIARHLFRIYQVAIGLFTLLALAGTVAFFRS